MARYPKNWDSDAVKKYFAQESRQKNRSEFDRTHVPIERIKLEQDQLFSSLLGKETEFINESEALEGIIDSELKDPNRLFFVVGEAGCGKSELCQWLEYRVEEQREKADGNDFTHQEILIPRNVREPKEVIQILGDHLGKDFEDARLLSELPPEGVYQQTRGTIINQFTKEEDATVEFLQDKNFKQTLKENLSSYMGNFEEEMGLEFEPVTQEQISSFLEDYPEARREHEGRPNPPESILYDKIKSGAEKAIQDMLELGDIKPLLSELNEEFQNRNQRPVLIIEDLTGFTIYEHEILSFFSDLQNANWDVVIGVTTGRDQKLSQGLREDQQNRETINDRTQARLVLTEQTGEGSQTLFLEQEDVHIKLAKKYLDAIKQESDKEFPEEVSEYVERIDEDFDGVYPFNKRFLDQVYENLREGNNKKKTPRIYLKFVLEDLLDSENPPFQHINILDRVELTDSGIDPDYNKEDKDLIRWYGELEDDILIVPDTIPKVFDVDSDGKAPTFGSDRRKRRDPETEPDPGKDEKLHELEKDLRHWLEGKKDFNKTESLESGAERVLTFFYDNPNSLVRDEASSRSGYISWDKGGATVPVHVDNGDEPNYTKVVLHSGIDKEILIQLLIIGVYEETPIEDHIQSDQVNLTQLRAWSDQVVENYRQKLESDIKEGFGVSIDEIALYGKYICNLYSGNGSAFTAQSLKKPIEGEFKPALVPTPGGGNLSNQANPNTLAKHVDTLTSIFQARFHIRKNFVNYDRLNGEISELDIDSLTDKIRNVDRNATRGFKVGTGKRDSIDLKDLLTKTTGLNLAGFAQDFEEYRSKYETDRINTVQEIKGVSEAFKGINKPSEIELDELEDAFTTTGRNTPECLEDLADMDEDKFRNVLDHIERTLDGVEQADNVWEYLEAFRAVGELTTTEYSDEYRTLEKTSDRLNTLERDLDHIIEDSGVIEDYTPVTAHFEESQKLAETISEKIRGGL